MGLLCLLRNKDSGAPVVDPVQAIDHDQLLLRDSYAAHYTTAEWSGFEHLLADRKYTVGTLRTPRAGRCWLFDGTDDYATRAHPLASASDFTVMAWVKMTSAGSYPMIMASDNASKLDFRFDAEALRLQLAAHDSTGASGNVIGSSALSTGVWYHVAATYTASTRTVTLYINGVSDGSGVFSAGSGGTPNNIVSGANMQIGLRASSTNPFTGRMRDFRLYSNVKSAAEILAIKNQADTPGTYDTTGLLAGYWCEEESGTTGYDWSGNGRHLTLTNITQATFHASDTGVTYSDANVRGFDQFKKLTPSGSGTSYDSTNTWISTTPLTGDFTVRLMPFYLTNVVCGVQSETSKIASNNYTQIDVGVQVFGSYVRVHVNNVITTHTVATAHAVTDVWSIVRVGTTASIYQNGVLVTTKTIASSTMYATVTNSTSDAAAIAYNSGLNMEQDSALLGSNQTTQMLIVPAISSTVAANGATLSHTGKCPQPGYAPQRCVTGDGSSVHVDTQSFAIGTSDFTFTFWAKGTGAPPKVAVYMPSLSIHFISSATISLYDYTGPGHVFGGGALNNWNATSWHKVVVSRSSGQISVAVDGVVNATAANTSNFGTGTIRIFGFSGQYWDGQVSNASLLLGGVTYYWPLCEGPGSGNTNRDVHYLKSDNTSGVVSSAIVNGTVSTIWANATDYTSGVFNWPLRYGYTVNGSGVIVPAKLDGLLDAAGNAIGQAAGGWASGLQNLNCLPYTNPLGVSVGLETSLDPTADRKTTSSSKRRRRNTSGRYDRFGARSTAMSDASSNAYFGD